MANFNTIVPNKRALWSKEHSDEVPSSELKKRKDLV